MIDLLLIPIFGLIRVMRGGLGPWQPPRPLMWAMPPSALFWLTGDYTVALLGIILSVQYNIGYRDFDGDGIVGWDDEHDMSIRSLASVAYSVCIIALVWFDRHETDLFMLFFATVAVFVSNVGQVQLRKRLADRGHWANRSAELIEGMALGGLICAT